MQIRSEPDRCNPLCGREWGNEKNAYGAFQPELRYHASSLCPRGALAVVASGAVCMSNTSNPMLESWASKVGHGPDAILSPGHPDRALVKLYLEKKKK